MREHRCPGRCESCVALAAPLRKNPFGHDQVLGTRDLEIHRIAADKMNVLTVFRRKSRLVGRVSILACGSREDVAQNLGAKTLRRLRGNEHAAVERRRDRFIRNLMHRIRQRNPRKRRAVLARRIERRVKRIERKKRTNGVVNRNQVEFAGRSFESARHRLQPRIAAGDERHALAGRRLHRVDELLHHRHDHTRHDRIEQESLHGALHERLAAERLELLRHVAAETRSASGSGDDDEDPLRVGHYTAMMSTSLLFRTPPTSSMCLSVIFWISSSACLSSSSEISWSLSIFLSLSLPSRRTWRMAVRDSSAM